MRSTGLEDQMPVSRDAARGRILTGGDVDADALRAESSGEEAVGGSVSTPDQDVVDEIGRALGVEQEIDAEVRSTDEILRERDRSRWRLEREAADRDDAVERGAAGR
jgi:hypothetical protein